MKILLATHKKSEDFETKKEIDKEIMNIRAVDIQLDLNMLKLQNELEKNPDRKAEIETMMVEVKIQKDLILFNYAMVNTRRKEYETDQLITKVEDIVFCCGEMKDTYKDGELYRIDKNAETLYFQNGTFYGETFLSESEYPVNFCQYCGTSIKFEK